MHAKEHAHRLGYAWHQLCHLRNHKKDCLLPAVFLHATRHAMPYKPSSAPMRLPQRLNPSPQACLHSPDGHNGISH